MPPSSPPFVKTYPVNLAREPGMPTGIHDPAWKDPVVASKVGLEQYHRALSQGTAVAALRTPADLAPLRKGTVETRTFALSQVHTLPNGTRVRTGSFGEIHRRYSFGGRLPGANFHAMVVAFGVDSTGRCFLKATVGRHDGAPGNRGALSVGFSTATGELGGLAWEGELDPAGDHPVLLLAQAAPLQAAFDDVTTATVVFLTVHGKAAP